MIPHFEIPEIWIFKPFGILVAAGILLGGWLAQKRAVQAGQDFEEVRRAVAWAVVVGFIGAHLVAILYYKPHRLLFENEGPLLLLKVWDGISSYGGFFGAIIGMFIFYGHRSRPLKTQILICASPFLAALLVYVSIPLAKVAVLIAVLAVVAYYFKSDKPWLGEVESMGQGLLVGWLFGRAGCTVAFDHPGQLTTFFLAQEHGLGGPIRHNLGFYEFLYTLIILLPLSLLLFRRNPPRGVTAGAICLAYAPARFGFDFLRATDLAGSDLRYLALTPAQWSSLVFAAMGLYLIRIGLKAAKEHDNYPHVQAERADLLAYYDDVGVTLHTMVMPALKSDTTRGGKAAAKGNTNEKPSSKANSNGSREARGPNRAGPSRSKKGKKKRRR